jgi:hypothetical protein
MSALAITLFENREDKNDHYQPLVRAIFPEAEYDSALDENREFTAAVQDVLCELNESNPFGALQWYFVEEYFLHGKSKEEIGKEIAENMDLLLKDLEISAIRFLRRPAQSRMLRTYIKK